MAWLPISGTLPQYSTSANELANDYYLKFYAAGTSTPINMATDSTGGTLLAKCALSADGYPISNPLDDSTAFIPHIDQNYRVVLYTNETDADNNATGSAAFNIDGMQLQAIVTGDAADVTLRAETLEEFDDYDRSPLFTDGDGFTAGAGPHVITVPAGWTPTNSDMRFYKLDNSGIVTPLTPTAKTATTFTLTETLLSTDTVFLGDDVFRASRADLDAMLKANNLSDVDNVATARSNLGVSPTTDVLLKADNLASVSSASASFDNIKQTATNGSRGVVYSAVAGDLSSGTSGYFPDSSVIRTAYGRPVAVHYPDINAGGGPFPDSATAGWLRAARIGSIVTITGYVEHASATGFTLGGSRLPAWVQPDIGITQTYQGAGSASLALIVNTDGSIQFFYPSAKTSSGVFTVTFIVDDTTSVI